MPSPARRFLAWGRAQGDEMIIASWTSFAITQALWLILGAGLWLFPTPMASALNTMSPGHGLAMAQGVIGGFLTIMAFSTLFWSARRLASRGRARGRLAPTRS